MAEFCKCGSIMISGSCTNKSCSNKLVKVSTPKVKAASAKTPAVKKEAKSTRVTRASKCITYNLNDLPPKEE
ncbi:MAG TPA: hypothetical protein VIK78_04890 [Ruminiclostridium sp.]